MKIKNQTKVLREIKRNKSDMTINEIVEQTEFTKRQVYNALADLKNRKLIVKRMESIGARQKKPPKNRVYISLNEKAIRRINKVIEKEYPKK